VQHVEADDGRLADHVAAAQRVEHLVAEVRDVGGDGGADRDRPERELVPRQEVAGEGEAERQEQQDDADAPVELARPLVRAGVEDPAHVEEDDQHHRVGRPAVQIAQEAAERHRVLEVLDRAVRLGRVRHVIDHQQHAGDRQDAEEDERDPAEAERRAKAQRARAHLRRMQMEQQALGHHLRPFAVGAGPRHAEDRLQTRETKFWRRGFMGASRQRQPELGGTTSRVSTISPAAA
jgi:hypothetical protein